jgi:hypothetical protein
MSDPTYNLKYSAGNPYIRYDQGIAYLFMPSGNECVECCPSTFATLWEHPNIACALTQVTHQISLTVPFWHFPSGNTNGQINPIPNNAYSILCGTPPLTNLSSRIEIKIPYDPVFSGTYIFDWRAGNWIYHTGLSQTSLSKYPDAGNTTYYDKLLVNLVETSDEPTYKGYVESARLTSHTSNLSGVFAYPGKFVFTAMQAPSDVTSAGGTPASSPTGSGHRAVVGFNLPIRWRHEYNDWVITDSVGHKISGTKTSNAGNPSWIPSVECFPSGYATSISGPYTVGLSGITNNPSTYDLSDATTAIVGSCTGLAHLGFSYKTSASGIPFDSTTYDTKLSNFSGIRPKFAGAISHGSFTVNETRLFQNKTPMEAWITFSFSCRQSGTVCNDFDSIIPVSTGFTSISASCLGSYINADFACGDNLARPTGSYFTTESVTGLKVVYSGIADNVYPLVKTTKATANLYKANSGQMIFINYSGANTPEDLRSWINKEFNFVKTDISNNVTYSYPGVDLYWNVAPLNESTAGVAWARLIPCDSAAFEPAFPGVYLISVNGKFGYESGASDLVGQYGHDSTTNRYINVNNGNGNYQMRFILNKWHLGKVENNSFVSHYTMEYTTGGIPQVLLNSFTDYSDFTDATQAYSWNVAKIPVSCKSAPIGEWISVDIGLYPGVAISVKDPIPTAWNAGNTCGA